MRFSLCLAILLLVFRTLAASAQPVHVRVASVLDGDTFIIEGGERIRLRGIDAPEISPRGESGQYYGQASRELLGELIRGRDVVLDRDEWGTDRYGRKVAVAMLPDGRMLNAVMVAEGAAFVLPFPAEHDEWLISGLLEKQRAAMDRKCGFWGRILALPQAGNRYLGNKNSKRFHLVACTQGGLIRPANQIGFSSLSEAFRAGFAPARECTVWPHGE